MKMPRPFFDSIRFKIFILYIVVLALTLTFFNLLVYRNHAEVLEHKIDLLLDARVQAVESAVLTYWKAEAAVAPALAPKPDESWFKKLFGGEPEKPAPVPVKREDPYTTVLHYLTYDDSLLPNRVNSDNLKIYVDIFDMSGRLTDSSHAVSGFKTLGPDELGRILRSKKVLYDFSLKLGKERMPGRALAKVLERDGKPAAIVQARVPMNPIRVELNELLVKLFMRSAVVILLASWGSFFLVRRTLKPVDQMTRAIRSIKPDNLDRRIAVPGTDDEIARLAETFNGLLERLERSFRAQRQMIQDVSHELKTPLTIVRGQFEVALRKTRSVEEYQETLVSALEEVVKLRRIVDNLLMLAKFDDLNPLPEMQSVDLNSLLEGILQDIRLLSRDKSLEVRFEPGGPLTVQGNEAYLERLFRNLLENAVKYNMEGGFIRVASRQEDGQGRVIIEDSGIGIAADQHEKIFDRFYRVDPARSSGNDSFGLGLSIVKSVVEAHGGRIEVESAPGLGTTFSVWLPATEKTHAVLIGG